MTQNLTSLGILIILIGFALVLIGALTQVFSGGKSDTKVAFGGFIGFIPFGFSNDKRLLWTLITIMGIAMVLFLVTNFFFQYRIK